MEHDVWYAATSAPAIIDGATVQISKRSPIFRCPRGSNQPGNTDRDGLHALGIAGASTAAVLGCARADLCDARHVARVRGQCIRRRAKASVGLRQRGVIAEDIGGVVLAAPLLPRRQLPPMDDDPHLRGGLFWFRTSVHHASTL